MKSEIKDTMSFAANPDRAAKDVARFEEAYASLLGRRADWTRAPALLRIFGNSRALTERLIANPEWLDDTAGSPVTKDRELIRFELQSFIKSSQNDEISFKAVLRRFKYRELTRLVSKDLSSGAETRGMLAEWSDVADALIDAAYEHASLCLFERFGRPLSADGAPCKGSIIALGKLGGCELNVSSDVDLLFIYGTDEGGAAKTGGRALTNHEWFVRLAAATTKLLTEPTADGFVFRVDHDLRPEGPQGPLANSLDAALRYYEYFGQGWERQAMIRARPCAGDPELGSLFVEGLRPFVYRRTMGLADLAHMRELKKRMASGAPAAGSSFDVKHGAGGIREAEFLVQAIELLHGGAHPSVRKSNTFEAIEALANEHLIHPHGSSLLLRSYSFLRRLENMIQCEGDQQLHRIPEHPDEERSLALRMGFHAKDPAAALRSEIFRHTRGVSRLFEAIFEADYERQELEDALEANISRAADEEEAADSLAWFKQWETRRLASLDLEGAVDLKRLFRRLTLVAEVVLACAWRMAYRRLEKKYGTPRTQTNDPAGFAIVAMGRMGSMELDYGSDLDLIFLYSGPGQTDGRKQISNVEFFTMLAQRTISIISLPTRYGKAYAVDSELRPSGRAGTLVATLDSFKDYHSETAEIWERLALLRARPVAGDKGFMGELKTEIRKYAYSRPPPLMDEARMKIDRLRTRTIEERTIGEGGSVNIKIGRGGLADLESAIQLLHLMHACKKDSLHRQNTFEVVNSLAACGIIDEESREEWLDHFTFYRRLIARMRLLAKSSTDLVSAGAPYAAALAGQMGFFDPAALMDEIARRRSAVRGIYESIIVSKP